MDRLFRTRRRTVLTAIGVGLVVAGLAGLSAFALNRLSGDGTNVAVAPPDLGPPAEIEPGTDTILAVGDIAVCGTSFDEQTARLAQSLPGTILALGDIVYEAGTERDFNRCFEPSWGALKERIRPVPGNHEFETAGAGPYYEYFGDAAGTPGLGWYSFDVGAWHIIALNSNCQTTTNLCSDDSAQGDWLEDDLARHPTACTLAFMHHPRWTSGEHGHGTQLGEFWTMLYDAGVDVVLAGHDHNYERFAPMDASGAADPAAGVRQFVVGTGGRSLDRFLATQPNSEARNNVSYGVLQMALYDGHYTWEFIPTDADGYRDAGEGTCH